MTIVVSSLMGWLLIIVLFVPALGIVATLMIGIEYLMSRFLRFAPQAKGFRKWKRKYFPPQW